MKIANDKIVNIDYTLTSPDGTVLDSSEGTPLPYLHGKGNIIDGLEKALEGKTAGDHVDVVIAPADGYGERQEDMVQKIERSRFEGVENIEPGMQFQAESPEGIQMIMVVAADEEIVTVDGNHPLAGVELHFSVDIREVRDASAEELEHGHVHGPDGHHH